MIIDSENPNTTSTEPNLTLPKVGFYTKMTQTQYQSELLLTQFRPNFKVRVPGPSSTDSDCHFSRKHLSGISQLCYWPNFDKKLKVDSWDLFEHIPTITITFVQTTLVFATFVHIRNISAVTDPIVAKEMLPKSFFAQTYFHHKIFLNRINIS